MFVRGSIFIAKKFKYSDGSTGKKLLVLLNNPYKNTPYVVVKTTSKQHSKPSTPGCIASYHKAYYIPGKQDFFEISTWIQLDDYFLFDQNHIDPHLKHIGDLSPKRTEDVISCFLSINEQDLSPKIRSYIVPQIMQDIQALTNKFNKRI
jgi:hypothetical protein